MTDTRACVDWFDWDIWISDEPGQIGRASWRERV